MRSHSWQVLGAGFKSRLTPPPQTHLLHPLHQTLPRCHCDPPSLALTPGFPSTGLWAHRPLSCPPVTSVAATPSPPFTPQPVLPPLQPPHWARLGLQWPPAVSPTSLRQEQHTPLPNPPQHTHGAGSTHHSLILDIHSSFVSAHPSLLTSPLSGRLSSVCLFTSCQLPLRPPFSSHHMHLSLGTRGHLSLPRSLF